VFEGANVAAIALIASGLAVVVSTVTSFLLARLPTTPELKKKTAETSAIAEECVSQINAIKRDFRQLESDVNAILESAATRLQRARTAETNTKRGKGNAAPEEVEPLSIEQQRQLQEDQLVQEHFRRKR